MHSWRKLAGPVAVVLIWAVTALASMAQRDLGGASVLLWVPAGIMAGAFYTSPRRRWPILIALFFLAQCSIAAHNGVPLVKAALYALAALSQSLIAVILSWRVLGGRRARFNRFRQVAGIFAAAAIASAIGALLALGLRENRTLDELSWWFLANLIGIMTVSPIFVRMQRMWRTRRRLIAPDGLRDVLVVVPAFASLSIIVLFQDALMLGPVIVTALMLIAFRYDQRVSALAVLVFGLCATLVSAYSGTPLPQADLSERAATLTLQVWMLILLMTRLPLAAMLFKREELQLALLDRNAQMHESLMLFDLAEETAGIGRWRLNLVTGAQEWSPRMLELTGFAPGTPSDPGDFTALMPDGGEEFCSHIRANRDNRDTYSFTYSVKPAGETERMLRIAVLNEYDVRGTRIGVFGVAMDVTQQVRREEALDLARSRAVRLAAEAQKLANTDPLTSLPNRRCTFGRLESMIAAAAQNDGELTAIMFDIDHFKQVNDVYGHQTGDEVLVQVAELARRQARSGDLVGRIGGEEFVWLLPGLPQGRVHPLAERLRRSVEMGIEGSDLPDVTVSIGVAHFRPGDDEESLLARADAGLYQAKEHGRNQVRRAA